MFSIRQKRVIADGVQALLQATGHPELPNHEVEFTLQVRGKEAWSFAVINNNGAVTDPTPNPWNEKMDERNDR